MVHVEEAQLDAERLISTQTDLRMSGKFRKAMSADSAKALMLHVRVTNRDHDK